MMADDGANDSWAGRVSADMERIFRRDDLRPASAGGEGGAGDRPRGFVIQSPAPDRAGPSPVLRALTIAIPVLAIVVAIFLVVQIAARGRPATAMAGARPAAVAPPPRAAAAAYHAAAPVASAPSAVVAAEAGDALPAPSPTVEVRRARIAAPAVGARAPVPVAARGDGCHPGSTDNACIYRDVRAADRRLVAAYRLAAEAGVPRGDMIAIRREWTRALAESLDDPDGTIRIYDDLARRLHDAAARMDGRRA